MNNFESEIEQLCREYRSNWTVDSVKQIPQILSRVEKLPTKSAEISLVRLDVMLLVDSEFPFSVDRYAHLTEAAREVAEVAYDKILTQRFKIEETRLFLTDHCSQCGDLLDEGDDLCQCHNCGFFSEAPKTTTNWREDLFLGTDRTDRYIVESPLGEGAFGIVHKAWDTVLQRFVALKMPKKSITGQTLLAREARAASRLKHNNIVRIFDVVELEESLFVVSDFIDGVTLAIYRQKGELSIEQSCILVRDLALAMEHAHANDVVHRDLKPSNILVDQTGCPHILDFGLSRSRVEESGSISRTGKPIGTPAFMPPEQAVGDLERIGPCSDIYSLGVILFQLLSQKLPFSGDTDVVLGEVISQRAPSIRSFAKEVPPALDAIVAKALEKEPEDRYQSSGEFAEDLSRFLEFRKVSAFEGWDWRVARRKVRSGLIPVGLVFVLCTMLLYVFLGPTGILAPAASSTPGIDELIHSPVDARIQVKQPCSSNIIGLDWSLISQNTGLPELAVENTEPGSVFKLEPGLYLVTVHLDSGNIWEVHRTVPEPNQIPIGRLGVPLHHRSWLFKDDVAVLPKIDFNLPRADENTVFVSAYNFAISTLAGPSFAGKQAVGQGFLISNYEVTKSAVMQTFPRANITFIDWDIAIAYCEEKHCCLPTAFDYAAIEQQEIRLAGFFDKLAEWTSTLELEIRIDVGSDEPFVVPASTSKATIVKSIESEKDVNVEASILSVNNMAVDEVVGNPDYPMGFRKKFYLERVAK